MKSAAHRPALAGVTLMRIRLPLVELAFGYQAKCVSVPSMLVTVIEATLSTSERTSRLRPEWSLG